jgi:uncharacterized linocin/CFP29 family protein
MHPIVTTDAISGNGQGGLAASGSVAKRLLSSGFNVNALRPAIPDAARADPSGVYWHQGMRANATLRRLEWQLYDTAVISVARRRLVGVADLIAMGLTYNVPDALGVTQIVWEQISTMTAAEISMSGLSQTPNDRQEFSLLSLPLPIIHKDFNINIRQLHSSRRIGTPLDVTQAELSSRIVSEGIESILFVGTLVLGTNNQIYGYTTAPHRATGSVTAPWATATGTQIVTDTLAMIAALVANNMYGPYMMYVPSAVYTAMGADFKAFGDKTILSRVLEIPGISGIKQSKDLTASNIILVQMTSDVIDMVDGMQPTTVEWETDGGMIVNFKVMAIMVPRVKFDYVTQSGIAHFS